MTIVGVYNEYGEPLGTEVVYEDDPNDWADYYDQYDRDVYDDRGYEDEDVDDEGDFEDDGRDGQ